MPHGLFAGLFARGAAAEQASERAVLAAMVEVELALVRALAGAGLAPPEAARSLPDAETLADRLDVAELGRSSAEKGTPVPALVAALRRALGEHPAAGHLHRGATSQDIVDTALMLVARRALAPLLADLSAAGDRCAALAVEHRDSVQPGRTLLQQAVPVSFGLTAASWLSALDGARAGLRSVRDHELAVQLGGAAGTLAALGQHGVAVMEAVANELGLATPALPWHAVRVRPARLASALGVALGATGKVGRDVALLAQTEVGEVTEARGDGRGGSSAMPHKRNPVGAVAVIACAARAPGLVATILAAMPQEHGRAPGGWQAEWEPLLELLRLAGSAAVALRELLDGLEVHPERMRANLELTAGLLMSESVVAALAGPLGGPRARELVDRAAAGDPPLREALLRIDEVAAALSAEQLDAALDPARHLGASGELIDRALAAHDD